MPKSSRASRQPLSLSSPVLRVVFHADVRDGLRHRLPGAVRVSANRQTYLTDIPLLGQALRKIAATPEGAERYVLDHRGDFVPRTRSLVGSPG